MKTHVRILFVCLGNICRSPLAEGVFRRQVERAGLSSQIDIDSAGTGSWHVGEAPDTRMQATSSERGVDISQQQARQVTLADLARFDHIFVMDKDNLSDVLSLDPDGRHHHKVRLFREFDPEPGDYQVPDPYYGGADGFGLVFDIAERTASMILHRLVEEYGLRT